MNSTRSLTWISHEDESDSAAARRLRRVPRNKRRDGEWEEFVRSASLPEAFVVVEGLEKELMPFGPCGLEDEACVDEHAAWQAEGAAVVAAVRGHW